MRRYESRITSIKVIETNGNVVLLIISGGNPARAQYQLNSQDDQEYDADAVGATPMSEIMGGLSSSRHGKVRGSGDAFIR